MDARRLPPANNPAELGMDRASANMALRLLLWLASGQRILQRGTSTILPMDLPAPQLLKNFIHLRQWTRCNLAANLPGRRHRQQFAHILPRAD